MLILFICLGSSLNNIEKENDDTPARESIDLNSLFNENKDFFLPLVLMTISFFAICIFYFIHMKRIMKEITNAAPAFDLVDNETKIDFTIAERHSG